MAAERIIGGLTLGSFGKESHVDSTSEREQRRQIADMSKGYGQLVDETVALWSKMVFEDSHAKERAFKKVKNMQTNGLKILKALGAKLDCLGQCGVTLKDKAVEIEEFWQKQLGAKQEKLENLLAEKQRSEELQNQLTERQRKRIEELENQKFHDQLTEKQRKRIEELENQLADYHDQLTEKQRKRIDKIVLMRSTTVMPALTPSKLGKRNTTSMLSLSMIIKSKN
jgi:septal ring factor EnvC (AmiA/AmiB activator)